MERIVIETLHTYYWQILDLVIRARNIAGYLEEKAGFDVNQPRVPAGNREGGQWTDDSRWTNSPNDNFDSYDDVIGNDLPEADILQERRWVGRDDVPAKIFIKESSVPDEKGEKVKRINIFIGGYDDDTNKFVRNSDSLKKETVGENYYATENMTNEIQDFIKEVPPDYEINVIGHSYGGDAAAEIAEELPERSIDNLVTIDPVGRTRPDFKKVKKKVGKWTNVNGVDKVGRERSSGDEIADIGGDWENNVAEDADIYLEAERVHEDFDGMMRTPSDDGRSPQDILNGKKAKMNELLDEIYQDSNNDFYGPKF